jgi:hypothetical protein
MIKTSVLFVFSAIAFCLSISGQITDIYKVNTNGIKEKVDTTEKSYSGGTEHHKIITNGVKEKTDTLKKPNIGGSDSCKVNSSGTKDKVSTMKKNNKSVICIYTVPPHYGVKKSKRMQERYKRKLEKTFGIISK